LSSSGAQQTPHLGQFVEGGGAHVGALDEAEEHDHGLAAELLEAAHLAVLVGQIEILGVVGARHVDGLEP
jgi:hypothetical protein